MYEDFNSLANTAHDIRPGDRRGADSESSVIGFQP